MDPTELSSLYRQALKVKDEAVRQTLARSVAQVAASRTVLADARQRANLPHSPRR